MGGITLPIPSFGAHKERFETFERLSRESKKKNVCEGYRLILSLNGVRQGFMMVYLDSEDRDRRPVNPKKVTSHF